MTNAQGAIPAAAPPEGGANAVEQTREVAARAEMAQQAGGREGAAVSFRGMLLRRRCDSCGTRISVFGEVSDRVFMRCPDCLREYVFFYRPE
ncbi:MAG: hypothetical protein ACP5IL_07415 [Syntrophobacteraceae bacterium]